MATSPLEHIPTEILLAIVAFLPRSSIAHLSLTSRQIYTQCLPAPYANLELSFSFHIKQLLHASHERPVLKQVLEYDTKHLHLICRQSESHLLIATLVDCIPNIHTLTFSDFHALPIEQVCQQILLFPNIQHLNFRCCNLVLQQQQQQQRLEDLPPPAVAEKLTAISRLELTWTGFTAQAVDYLLSRLPDLTSIDLGSNHNRNSTANGLALKLLQDHCPRIRDLSVSLQQHRNDSICDLIAFYGPQLIRLAIHCDNPHTLNVVATHASGLQGLTLHAIGGPWQTPLSHKSMLGILCHCPRLVYLKMASWMVQDVPGVVWQILARQKTDLRQLYYLDDQALCHQRAIRHRDIGCLNKTLALDMEELHELRKVLCC